MKQLVVLERLCLVSHVVAMAFGLAGLLLVLPHPEFIAALPPFGQALFGWSMMGGGVIYIVLAAIAVSIYAYRTVGLSRWLSFMLPAIFLSLGSELLGTSTGFPFGHYGYLSGLGYKIAGLVPFTIPLSWFYVGFSTYLLARVGLEAKGARGWLKQIGAIVLGAVLLTAWDFVLDPAMSQAPYPFWEFQDVGQFFGMPYHNLTGWVGTGMVFMTVASMLWRQEALPVSRSQLTVPLVVYLVNFAFGAIITVTELDVRFWIPTAIGAVLGILPAVALWWVAKPAVLQMAATLDNVQDSSNPMVSTTSQDVATVPAVVTK